MFHLLEALVCIIILLCQCGIENAKISASNRKYREYLKSHNFNMKLQKELMYNKRPWELAEMLGTDWYTYTKKRFGNCSNKLYLALSRYAMVKDIMESKGYDYCPQHDDYWFREMCKRNGFTGYTKDSPFYGL